MSFREERSSYWLESFTWGYGRLLCPLAARDLLVVVKVDIGGHPETETMDNQRNWPCPATQKYNFTSSIYFYQFPPIAENWGYKYININVWSPPSLGGSRRLQWWRLDMTTQSVIHNIHSLLSSLSAQSAITAPGRRHVSHVSLCWTKQKVPTWVLFLYKVSNSTFTLLWTGFWTSYFHMKLWCLSAKPSSLEGLVSNP